MDTDRKTIADLRAANEQLKVSLDKCHELVAEYRSKLTANTNSLLDECAPQDCGLANGGSNPSI